MNEEAFCDGFGGTLVEPNICVSELGAVMINLE